MDRAVARAVATCTAAGAAFLMAACVAVQAAATPIMPAAAGMSTRVQAAPAALAAAAAAAAGWTQAAAAAEAAVSGWSLRRPLGTVAVALPSTAAHGVGAKSSVLNASLAFSILRTCSTARVTLGLSPPICQAAAPRQQLGQRQPGPCLAPCRPSVSRSRRLLAAGTCQPSKGGCRRQWSLTQPAVLAAGRWLRQHLVQQQQAQQQLLSCLQAPRQQQGAALPPAAMLMPMLRADAACSHRQALQHAPSLPARQAAMSGCRRHWTGEGEQVWLLHGPANLWRASDM